MSVISTSDFFRVNFIAKETMQQIDTPEYNRADGLVEKALVNGK